MSSHSHQEQRKKFIFVLTSGGDAPGMNAAVRATVRASLGKGWRVFGVRGGYKGLTNGQIFEYDPSETEPFSRSVAGCIQKGGTVLGSRRFPEFKDESRRKQALHHMKMKISDGPGPICIGLVAIGGDGSFRGALGLSETNKKTGTFSELVVVGIPATIDNDIPGTRVSIGADTAVNTAVDAIDKIRDTARSHRRVFFIEVMGRRCDFLPTMVGLASGAHRIIGPGDYADIDEIVGEITVGFELGKSQMLYIVAGGVAGHILDGSRGAFGARQTERASLVAQMVWENIEKGYRSRIKSMNPGHMQRGGSPSGYDRRIATVYGDAAVQYIASPSDFEVVAGPDSAGVLDAVMVGVSCQDEQWDSVRFTSLELIVQRADEREDGGGPTGIRYLERYGPINRRCLRVLDS